MTVASKQKEKSAEEKLTKTLKETFPASDPSSGNIIEHTPTRPVDRKPAELDKATVDKLAEEVKAKQLKP
jgi:hypothetical protein